MLFVNENGEGLLIAYINDFWTIPTTINVLDANETQSIVEGNAMLPSVYFATNGSVLLVNENESDTNSDITFVCYGFSKYIEFDLKNEMFSQILDIVLSEKHYDGHIVSSTWAVNDIFSEVWDVWIFESHDLTYIAKCLNDKASKTGDTSLQVSVTKAFWKN